MLRYMPVCLPGNKVLDKRTTATVLVSSISAGALVAIFAAKSVGIALAGAAGLYAVGEYISSPSSACRRLFAMKCKVGNSKKQSVR